MPRYATTVTITHKPRIPRSVERTLPNKPTVRTWTRTYPVKSSDVALLRAGADFGQDVWTIARITTSTEQVS